MQASPVVRLVVTSMPSHPRSGQLRWRGQRQHRSSSVLLSGPALNRHRFRSALDSVCIPANASASLYETGTIIESRGYAYDSSNTQLLAPTDVSQMQTQRGAADTRPGLADHLSH